jgi:glycerol-3-phosphate dehydrogenase
MNRAYTLDNLHAGEVFDLLVIGGGATGLGVAVDAAARGYTVALLERGDFAGGTSSRSTKLAHGGVRYLRQGDLKLVRTALRERGRLARNAPHLVRDLDFVIPAYGLTDRTFYGLGLKLYDTLAGPLSLGPSLMLSRAETMEHLINIEPAGLRGGVLYHDAQFDDARLAVTLALTATDHGAVLLNHAEVLEFARDGDRITGVLARDRIGGGGLMVRARQVINATGIFVDALRSVEDPAAAPLVSVSQGAHLVLPRRFLPGASALMVPKTDDGRVLFAIPWRDRVLVGTTDTARPAPETEPRALAEECAFLLEHARRYLADDPSPADVLSVFAGQRPLVRGEAGAQTKSLSRDHAISVGPGGLLTVTGGKWTTYRLMAEEVVDLAAKVAGLPPKPCPTADLPLRASIPIRPGSEILHPRLPYFEAEVRRAAREESAQTVEDVLSRRTRCLLLDAHAASACAPRVAAILAEEFGRNEAWVAAQVSSFQALAATYGYPED